MIIKVIQSKPNNGIPIWKIHNLGKITTNLEVLINQASIVVYSNTIPILSIINQDNSVNQYLFKNMTFDLIENQDYIINKPILESDLILFSENYKVSISIVNANSYSDLPQPSTVSGKYFFVLNKQGTSWLPGSLGGAFYNNGIYYSNGINWIYMSSPYQATQQTVNEGLITDQFVTPVTLNNFNKWSTKQDLLILNTNKLLGRYNSGVGAVEEITLGTNLSLSGNVLNASSNGGGSGGITRVINNTSINTIAGSSLLTDYVFFVTGTTTITLPTAIGNINMYTVKCISGITTIACNGTEKIDGSSTIQIAIENSVDLISNNIEWKIV